MAHYAIMRGDKWHTAEMNGIVKHITRTQETLNADAERAHLNYSVLGPEWNDKQGIHDAIAARTPEKFRHDAVRVLEYIVTATPEFFDENSDAQAALYFESAVDWFQGEFGTQNVVSAVVHRDESSPHMHVLVVPLNEETGRLSAKKMFGGKGVLHRRQSSFANHMADFGVERGREGSKRKHTKVAKWREGHSQLDDREAALEAREAAVAADVQKAANNEGNAATAYALARQERSAAAYEKQQASDKQLELEQREKALVARERELSEKVAALQAAAQKIEQQKAAWIAANKPTVPTVVQHLQHLETLGVIASAEYLEEQDSDELYDLFSPQDGLTAQGRTLLQQYDTVQERAEEFEETFTPSSSAPGL